MGDVHESFQDFAKQCNLPCIELKSTFAQLDCFGFVCAPTTDTTDYQHLIGLYQLPLVDEKYDKRVLSSINSLLVAFIKDYVNITLVLPESRLAFDTKRLAQCKIVKPCLVELPQPKIVSEYCEDSNS